MARNRVTPDLGRCGVKLYVLRRATVASTIAIIAMSIALPVRVRASIPANAYPSRSISKNVPPGQYTIVGWHERVGERTAPAQVSSGRPATIDLTVPVDDTL